MTPWRKTENLEVCQRCYINTCVFDVRFYWRVRCILESPSTPGKMYIPCIRLPCPSQAGGSLLVGLPYTRDRALPVFQMDDLCCGGNFIAWTLINKKLKSLLIYFGTGKFSEVNKQPKTLASCLWAPSLFCSPLFNFKKPNSMHHKKPSIW